MWQNSSQSFPVGANKQTSRELAILIYTLVQKLIISKYQQPGCE